MERNTTNVQKYVTYIMDKDLTSIIYKKTLERINFKNEDSLKYKQQESRLLMQNYKYVKLTAK